MSKRNKSKLKKQIKYVVNDREKLINIIIGALLIGLGITLLLKWGLSFALTLVGMFMSLVLLFKIVDTNTKFIGGMLFLFIFWKIFEDVCYWSIKLIKYGIDLINKKCQNKK